MADALNRRDFLLYGGAAAAGITLGETGRRWLARMDERVNAASPSGAETWASSVCRECPASCGIRVRLVDDVPVKLEGNPNCPLSRGRLCAKGQAAIESYFDPDRLVGPARRVGKRGSGLIPISWDEAIAALAAGIDRARESHGDILAIGASERGPVDEAWTNFWTRIGGRVASEPDRTARRLAPRLAALTGSTGAPVFDVEHATHILSFGAPIVEDWLSPLWTQRSYGRFRRGGARARGRLVHVDARRSTTARKADEWLPLAADRQPFLAYGIASVLLRENRLDRARLVATSANFAEFENDIVGRFTPDNVAAATGVPVVTLLRLARDLTATSQPLIAVNADADADLADAVFALNALVGAFDRPGGVLQSSDTSPRTVDADDALADLASHAGSSDVIVLRDASALRALRPTGAAKAALDRSRLVVSFSPYLDEAAEAADLLLPTHSSLESWHGIVPPSPDGTELFACARPAARARLDTRDPIAILHATNERLHGAPPDACPHATSDAAIAAELASLWSRRRGAPYANAFETNWMLQLERGGWWVPSAATSSAFASAVVDAGGWVDPFASRGALTDAISARGGLTFLPAAAPSAAPAVAGTSGTLPGADDPKEAPRPASNREWPLRLLAFTPPEVNLAGGPNQPALFELLGQPDGAPWRVWAELNPETARAAGIRNGARIRVASPSGAIEANAMIVERTLPDVVAVAYVPSLATGGRWARLMSADVRQLIGRDAAAVVRVRVTPV